MINVIWAVMAVIGIVYAMFNGTMDKVNQALFDGASEAVTLVIGLSSVLIFWLGMMRVAEKAGLLAGFSKLARPIVQRLFPDIPPDHPAMGYILANFSANLFGLGNAATPMGIKAMEEMKKISKSDKASPAMITFLIINTSSITLVPTTVIAIRMEYDSLAPTEIVVSTIIASVITTVVAVFIDRWFRKSQHSLGGS
ncbi:MULTISPECIES: nucleoside recognition domain-containing protein [Gracilibacillus]|uniref:nucleoside recognition domain-containing protein n=1 Tax=Gracilibacillus TaxID=74385 RepID=UPI0008259DF4|nr:MULTISPECIES: nucleoside recognition domain-containing protein [Gracilibacillus]